MYTNHLISCKISLQNKKESDKSIKIEIRIFDISILFHHNPNHIVLSAFPHPVDVNSCQGKHNKTSKITFNVYPIVSNFCVRIPCILWNNLWKFGNHIFSSLGENLNKMSGGEHADSRVGWAMYANYLWRGVFVCMVIWGQQDEISHSLDYKRSAQLSLIEVLLLNFLDI